MRLTFAGLLLVLVTLVSGCFKVFDTTCKEDDRTCLSNPLFALGIGGSCERDADCKTGLYCDANMCNARGETKRGDKCRLTAECGEKDYCGNLRACQIAGLLGKNEDCMDTGDCKHGFVCEPPDLSKLGELSLSKLAGVSGKCTEGGEKEQGEKCASLSECRAGLQCYEIKAGTGDKRCIDPPMTPAEIPALPALWPGTVCDKPSDTDTKQSYFEVPRGGKPLSEFYALPFPNDIRLKDGHIDLTGHPQAPDSYGLPIVKRYLDVAGEDLDGFSTNPVVFFRFSHPYDGGTVKCETPGACTIKIVDITPSSPTYGNQLSTEWRTTEGDISNYICPHFLAVRPQAGTVLRPSTTYAAIITTGIRTAGSGSFARGQDFAAMLAPSSPSDADLKAAYQAYEPLRAWIADKKSENEEGILNAAVFTTQSVDAIVPKLRAQVQSDGVPEISDWTVCDTADTKSPCEDSEGRGKCRAASSDFTEIHAHIRLPIFQQGKLPYSEPADGGGIQLGKSGDPVIQDHAEVCMAISVPTKPAPASGYPVLVFGHGTGGVFNGEMDKNGFAQVLATETTPGVLVAIDMPEHGSRRGDSTDEPDSLFYNFLNPRAARDNVLQGAADLFSVIHWVKGSAGLSASDTSLGAVPFDVAHIALMGHSQGSTHGSLTAVFEPDIIGVVLSGNGGHLATSMLTKTNPVNIAKVVPFGLLDPDKKFNLAAGPYNPALAIIQSVFDRADPVNYARYLWVEPTADTPDGRHAFMTYGVGDSYAPEETQVRYARSARLTAVLPTMTDQLGLQTAPAPLSGNATVGAAMRTVGLRQYTPTGMSDGHFVGVSKGQPGRPDVEHFLDGLLNGQTPEIGTP